MNYFKILHLIFKFNLLTNRCQVSRYLYKCSNYQNEKKDKYIIPITARDTFYPYSKKTKKNKSTNDVSVNFHSIIFRDYIMEISIMIHIAVILMKFKIK